MIAAAGAGKTTYLVNEALAIADETVLITTYTEANALEIKKKIIKEHGCVPKNITIQTWFSFLLQHGVRPYQGYIYEKSITGMILVNTASGINYIGRNGPVLYKESEEPEKFYFTHGNKIYSDKISKFVCTIDKKSSGAVVSRLSRIYKHIFIDEVQDLAGYDLEIIKLLLNSDSNLLMVGDPRQVTYLTHHPKKHKKYIDGKIKDFILKECNKLKCEIDETSLNRSLRNNKVICSFAAQLYPDYPEPKANDHEETGHDGIFILREQDVEQYLEIYSPTLLRWDRKVRVDERFEVINFGESKGLTFDRTLIYPTTPLKKWLCDTSTSLNATTRAKCYVALTRAKYSMAIVVPNDFQEVGKFPIFNSEKLKPDSKLSLGNCKC